VIEDEVTPPLSRSSEASTSVLAVLPSTRLSPLNCAAPTTESIWSFSAVTSAFSLFRSTLSPCAATIFSFIWVSRSVVVSAALRATATVDSPSDRLSEIALKPETSDSITFEMANTAELSLADETSLPVEIMSWVLARLELTDFRVCSAVMALSFVRMLDMASSFSFRRFAPVARLAPQGGDGETSF
jgi:hypothetical protein